MPRQPFHVLVRGFIRQPGFMGMNAERRINEIVVLRQANSAIHMRRPVTVADGNDGLHPGLASPSNDLLAVGVELPAVEMGVRVDKHGYGRGGRASSPVRAEQISVGF